MSTILRVSMPGDDRLCDYVQDVAFTTQNKNDIDNDDGDAEGEGDDGGGGGDDEEGVRTAATAGRRDYRFSMVYNGSCGTDDVLRRPRSIAGWHRKKGLPLSESIFKTRYGVGTRGDRFKPLVVYIDR